MDSKLFLFDSYEFDEAEFTARFRYQNNGHMFEEKISFSKAIDTFDRDVLDRALFLAFVLIGTSYYKTFPTRDVRLNVGAIDEWQARFFDTVYQEGLSQFAYENDLTRDDLAHFVPNGKTQTAKRYTIVDDTPLVLQSGGKDSLLLAQLFEDDNKAYSPWFLQNSEHHPAVLDTLASPLLSATRAIDLDNLAKARQNGALNGHVPVTFIVLSYALIQAILLGKNTVLAAIGKEGEEPHAIVGDLNITHQWSKTWQAEQLFAEYVQKYISPDFNIGSPLRGYSELRIAELFVNHAWERFGQKFSSCNRANYQQGGANEQLSWCGECPKCANSYLLFAPFIGRSQLDVLFGKHLFAKLELRQTFKGLLGVDNTMKPFECIGEIDELRFAYHLSLTNGYEPLPFRVPSSNFDRFAQSDVQNWVRHYF